MKQNRINTSFIWLLLILPVALFAIGILYIHHTGLFFLRCVDPEYAYLMNGLLMANLKLDVQFITNPGTPVQCIVALVLRGLHLFRPGQSLIDDVLKNPELYIRATIFTFNTINSLALFLLGYYTLKYSQNIIVALFLQVTPFTNLLTIEVLARMIPESLMNIIVCCWLIVIIKMLYQNKREWNYSSYSMIFGILFGLGLADKLTFFPFFLFPLIVLPTWKFRLRYSFFSLLFFLLFAFPVTLNHKIFLRWIKNIFIHTGAYGSGDLGILNWNEFVYHLKLQANNTRLLLLSVITLLVVFLWYFIKNRKTNLLSDLKVRIVFGLISLILMEYIMGAKHFAYHYMIPSILLTVFIILMSYIFLNHLFPLWASKGVMNLLLGMTGLILIASLIPKSAKQLKQIQGTTILKTTAYKKVAPFLKPSPKIIAASYYGCSAVEYAITYGLHESGKYGNYLFKRISKLYPSTILYFPWGKVFYEGNKEILPSSFLQPSTSYTLYIADYSEEKLNEILAALQPADGTCNYDIRNLVASPATAESLFLLKINSIDHAGSLMKGSK
jgi:hypothetical protein